MTTLRLEIAPVTRLALALAALALMQCGPAAAQPRAACAADAARLCPGKPLGQPMRECLVWNSALLSPACKQALDRQDSRRPLGGRVKPPWFDACSADIPKLCAEAPSGRDRVAECLRANQAQLSDACRAAIEK